MCMLLEPKRDRMLDHGYGKTDIFGSGSRLGELRFCFVGGDHRNYARVPKGGSGGGWCRAELGALTEAGLAPSNAPA